MATQRLPVSEFFEQNKSGASRWVKIALLVLAAVVAAAGTLLAIKWPFTPQSVRESLQQATATRVHIGSLKAEYFPHPGCVAREITFLAKPGAAQPLMTISTLTVRATYWGLFTKHIKLLRADHAHIALPPFGSGQSLGGKNQNGTVIDLLVADGTVLDVLPKNTRERPTRFVLPRFELRGLGGDRRLSFQAIVNTPKPPGTVAASGTFGPWKTGNAESTPVSGRYTFQHAKLAVFRGISGTLASQGKFQGSFHQLQIQGTTATPDFEAANSGHRFQLNTQFRALVDATNGDVVLQNVAALLGHTTIAAQGRIASTPPGRGKTVDLNFAVEDGRIEDVLLLFVKDKRAPLMGQTSFRAHVMLPPGPQPFMRKVQLDGEFGIGAARFTSLKTENSVTELSLRARGQKESVKEDPERVLSNLRGRVALKNGVGQFTNLKFDVPGARARMQGTYTLVNDRINLHGLLYMQAKLSNATSGIKSFLLKALGPFLKSNHRGEVVPVSITGTYNHPSYHISPQSRK